ncbi:hypothetical protein SGLAM104S_04680 [Streptomyces glaucescens]
MSTRFELLRCYQTTIRLLRCPLGVVTRSNHDHGSGSGRRRGPVEGCGTLTPCVPYAFCLAGRADQSRPPDESSGRNRRGVPSCARGFFVSRQAAGRDDRWSFEDHERDEPRCHRRGGGAAPLHGRPGRGDRGTLAGRLGRGGHLRCAEPHGRPGGRSGAGRQAQEVHHGHVPVPLRCGPARRPPAGLHRHRRLRAFPAHDRPQRPAHPGLRRLRPARRAVRRADRHAPARVHRGQHREHEGPAAAAGPGPRQAPVVRHDRPGLLQVDPVDLPADLQLLVRRRGEEGPPDLRAGRPVRVR